MFLTASGEVIFISATLEPMVAEQISMLASWPRMISACDFIAIN